MDIACSFIICTNKSLKNMFTRILTVSKTHTKDIIWLVDIPTVNHACTQHQVLYTCN